MPSYAELFARNYTLFTSSEMERLRESRCLVLGTGAMGGVVAVLMARAGVEHFILLDSDKFEPHNMNRQPGCLLSTIGLPKAESMVDTLKDINSEIEAKPVISRIQRKLVRNLMSEADVVLLSADEKVEFTALALDNAPIPVIQSAACGGTGWATTFQPYNKGCSMVEFTGLPSPKKRKEFWTAMGDDIGFSAAWRKDAEQGKIVPATWNIVTWLLGSIMCMEAVKIITGKWEPIFAPRFWRIKPSFISIETVGKKGLLHTLINLGKGGEEA